MAELQEVIEELDKLARSLGSRSALAKRFEVSRSFMSHVFNGRKKPTKEMLAAVGYREGYEKSSPGA